MISGILKSANILILTLFSSLLASLAGIFPGGKRISSGVMRWWGRQVIRIGRWSVDVEGLEHLPGGGGILAANHQSLVDIPLFITAIPRDVRFIAKRELGSIPLFGRAMANAGNLFVDRDDPRDAVLLVRDAAALMEQGKMVVIFPEGTRSPDGTIGEFRPGAFALARKTGAPLLPVYIDGGTKALRRGTLVFRPARLAVRILPPVASETAHPLSRDEMAEMTRLRILSARSEKEAASPGAVAVG